MKRTLSIIALAATLAAATNLMAAPATVLHQSFVDSQTFTFNGGTTIYRTFGQIELDVTNQIWVWGKVTNGVRFNRTDFVRIDTLVPAYDKACTLVTPTWISMGSYPDSTPLHFCHQTGGAYGDQTLCSDAQAGTYRPLGDGGLPASQGGGVRNGVFFMDSAYRTFVLVIKTASNQFNTGACFFGPTGGPGAIGSWILIEIANNTP